MVFTIQRLRSGDTVTAKELFLFFQADDCIARPVIPSDDYLNNLLSKNDFHVLVAMEGQTVIGGLTGYELPMYKRPIKEMFLYEIAVRPEFRQKGVASALIESLKNICKVKGIEEMYVGASAPNKAAMALYSSTGGGQEPDIAWFVYQCG